MSFPRLRWMVLLTFCVSQAGCCLVNRKGEYCDDGCYDEQLVQHYGDEGLKFEDPCLDDCLYDPYLEGVSPDDIVDFDNVQYWTLTLEETVAAAVENARVLRDLGGTILRSPNSLASVQDPSIAYADPRFGEEAALSAFDANLFASAFFDNNDRAFNNQFFGNAGVLVQDLGDYRWGITKRAATGSQFTFRHVTNYDFNNQLGNQFGTPSPSWDTYLEAEARQPLLQGAGVLFNRIAGPSEQPGVINGVLIARTNTDISLAQFEQGVRDLVSNVENAYWDLYFAYRDLDAKIEARNNALDTWRNVIAQVGREAGTGDKEGQAREQFFRFEAEVIDALNGRLVDGTQTNNGSSSGTFRNNGGVRLAERRLRLMVGLPINDGQLIRPISVPLEAPVRFDWFEITGEALAERPELRQQKWVVKQRELELIANRNFLMPRLDVVGRYRFRGFGRELSGGGGGFSAGAANPNAVADLLNGDRQEWQLGVEYSMPFGFRREHAAVRNSELRLAREQAVLREQEREVMFGLSNAVGEVRRAFEAKLAQYNRLDAATYQVDVVLEKWKIDEAPLDLLLEAQRRLVDTRIRFHQAEVEYMLALKNVHFEKGSYLEYCNVSMAESLWPSKAYRDARDRAFLRSREIDYVHRDLTIAAGPAGSTRHHAYEVIDSQMMPEPQLAPEPVENEIEGAFLVPSAAPTFDYNAVPQESSYSQDAIAPVMQAEDYRPSFSH